ncbi:MAG: hypothetical protein K2Q18_12525 [Bdellovibrionales bacterium]|nr:hypothetical protein [Bdellovibrionales bacterium]
MKNTLLILTLALSSMATYAATNKNAEARKSAIETCKAEGKQKNDLKVCVKEKLHANTSSAK